MTGLRSIPSLNSIQLPLPVRLPNRSQWSLQPANLDVMGLSCPLLASVLWFIRDVRPRCLSTTKSDKLGTISVLRPTGIRRTDLPNSRQGYRGGMHVGSSQSHYRCQALNAELTQLLGLIRLLWRQLRALAALLCSPSRCSRESGGSWMEHRRSTTLILPQFLCTKVSNFWNPDGSIGYNGDPD